MDLPNNSPADQSNQQQAPPGRSRCGKLLRTAALCGAYISLGLCMSVTGPTLPFLKDQVGSTLAEISWIFTARSIGTLGGAFLGGLVLDRFNPYFLFFFTVTAMALGTGVMPWCNYLWMLMVAAITVGIANGFLDTGASTVCLRLWGKESGPYMQAMHFAFALGGFLAPLLSQAFIGETTDLLNSNMTTLPFSTAPFDNITVKAILEAITLSPMEANSPVANYPTTALNSETNHSGTSPSDTNYSELFGVTQMHILYTVIAIIVFLTAFSFLFFICSSSDNRASSVAASAESQKLSEEQPNFSPCSKIFFVALLFSFYLLYVGAEVVFAQFLTTFALESDLHVGTSSANYITTTFWAAFAAARFGAIFFAHFMSPTKMLLLNLGLTTIGSLILCVAALRSIYVLYIGSALIGIGMASTFATGFVWTEKHLFVTNRISASFSVASSLGEMIFPTMTGALMETSSMSLMYVVLAANLLSIAIFLAARMLAKRQGSNRSKNEYQVAAQEVDDKKI